MAEKNVAHVLEKIKFSTSRNNVERIDQDQRDGGSFYIKKMC
jgi:hypothetical protein